MATKRPSDAEAPPSKKPFRSTYREMITVEVGTGDAPILVFKDLICGASAYFERICKGQGKEGQETKIKLPTATSDHFNTYLELLYAPQTDLVSLVKRIDARENVKDGSDLASHATRVRKTVCVLWVLGDFLQDPSFQNAAMDALISLQNSSYQRLDEGLVLWIAGNAAVDSPLGKWMVATLAPEMLPTMVDALHEKVAKELTAALLKRRLVYGGRGSGSLSFGEINTGGAPVWESRCTYHIHAKGAPRCSKG